MCVRIEIWVRRFLENWVTINVSVCSVWQWFLTHGDTPEDGGRRACHVCDTKNNEQHHVCGNVISELSCIKHLLFSRIYFIFSFRIPIYWCTYDEKKVGGALVAVLMKGRCAKKFENHWFVLTESSSTSVKYNSEKKSLEIIVQLK